VYLGALHKEAIVPWHRLLLDSDMNNVVLIIEDDDDLCHLLETVISKRGMVVRRISCVNEIHATIALEEPLLVLMDNHLVDGLGITFVSAIKKVCPASTVVLMTADDRHVIKQFEGFDQIDGFLAKPFPVADLESYLDLVVTQ
jgi:DNA-binding response OmpR family regulator